MIFEEIAELLDVQGANPFRIRAYRNAARTVSELGADIKTLMASGTELTEIPGIGKAHNTFELDGLRFGVGQARRGWLEKQDILNTRSLKELKRSASQDFETGHLSVC
jgi:DNA polymerase/3'-5' exonuclease PolX